METLFWIGLLLTIGYAAGIVSNVFRLPKVTAYIVLGMLLSPSVTHLLPRSFLDESSSIVSLALAVIAFMIGGSLKLSAIKKLEKSIFSVMLSASETTFAVTAAGLFFLLPFLNLAELGAPTWQHELLIALFFGAIGAATAPAAILAVIHQYRARGVLTSTLLGVVAIDDAVAIINFSLVMAVASILLGEENSWLGTMMSPVIMIVLSLIAGGVSGWLLAKYSEKVHSHGSLIVLAFGLLLMLYGAAEYFALDSLLVCMAFGAVFINATPKAELIFRQIQEHFEELIFVLFFILSGASAELAVLGIVWPIALAYVVLRLGGKVAGSWLGANIAGSEPVVKRYIGFAQMPQAGVAIGLALLLHQTPGYETMGELVLNGVIAATVINEIIGPIVLKKLLFKAGEAQEHR